MKKICIYFQVHQPFRLAKYSAFSDKNIHFDIERNREIFERVSRKCYLPTNKKILDLINEHNGKFKVSYSITGTLLEQAEMFKPEVIESFQKLVDTGCVDLLSETYYHSLAFLISKEEFKQQVKMHMKKIKDVFGVKPIVFRNTEAMYSNEVAKTAEEMGFKAIIAEGWHSFLGWRSPNWVYNAKNSNIKVLLRNYQLSDDVGFRFSSREWHEFPLTADKYADWIAATPGNNVNLFLDYETFGEHQWQETGIFDFLEHLPGEILKHKGLRFVGVNELSKDESSDEVDVPYLISWADMDRDISAWLENKMQHKAFDYMKEIGNKIVLNGDQKMIDKWRKLQTSDHFYYMCTKWFADGDIHKYFNSYDNPYDAYVNYMNVLQDLSKEI